MKNTPLLAALLTLTFLGSTTNSPAGNGGGIKSNPTVSTGTAPTTPAPAASDPRTTQAKQIETFIRSVLPAIVAAENGDDSSLEFLKDKVTYFATLQQQCMAAKANHTEVTALIKKLDPGDISIDSVKNEARANVTGNLISGGTSTPTLWVVSVKVNTGNSALPFSISQLIAAKLAE